MLQLDLNCDMGESTHLHPYDIKNDLHLFPYLSSINIACGGHAGDAQTMRILSAAAAEAGIAIGAHPGYNDRENFGRSAMNLSRSEINGLVSVQLSALIHILTDMGSRLHHVKPHGALYNAAAKDADLADELCKAIADTAGQVKLYGLSGSCLKKAAANHGLIFVSEVFADRLYQDDGSLTPRNLPDAVIVDPQLCASQTIDMALHGRVRTVSGKYISLTTQTICLHADGSHALEFAILINETLRTNNVTISRPS